MLNVLITGKSGRMGQALQQCAKSFADVKVAAMHDLGDDLAQLAASASCIIDFSSHTFTPTVLSTALERKLSLVIGSTGHSAEELAAIKQAAARLPIVFASNYSVGVNVLYELVRRAASYLPRELYDIEVVEMHHRHKIDAPSGTANSLLEVLTSAVPANKGLEVIYGRKGNAGPRTKDEIGMHALRGGDVVGDHTVIFAADGERIELSHKASSRMAFANGAFRAALWLQNKPAGLYDMLDVLGLK